MKTNLLAIVALFSSFLCLSAGPIKEYELKKKKQLEELRKNPKDEFKKMIRAASRTSSLYQQKPASIMIPDSIVNFSYDGTQYVQTGYEILQYSQHQKVDYVKIYTQGNLSQTIDFQYPGTPFATTILVNSSPSTSSQPDEKMELFFDSQNKLIKTKIYNWVNNSWQLSMADSLHIINNTANPPKPQEIRYFISEEGGPYKNVMAIKNITYDATTGLEKDLTFAIDLTQTGILVDFIKYENCTWELGHLDLRSIFLDYENICQDIYPRYRLFEEYNYAYYEGPTSYQGSILNPTTMQLELTERLLPIYSGNNIAFMIRQEYDGSGWDTVGRIVPTVVSNVLQQLDFETKVGSNFVLENQEKLLYDTQGNFSGILYIYYTASSVDSSGQNRQRTYTGGKLTEEILLFYTPGSGFQPSAKDLFFYNSNISVGELENDQRALRIYPNPASTSIHLTLPFDREWKISISDLTGRPVKNSVLSGQMGEISLNGLPAGTYVLTAHSEDIRAIQKLIVR